LQVSPIEFNSTVDNFLYDLRLQYIMKLVILSLNEKLEVLCSQVKRICEEVKPKLLFFLMRSLRFQIILQELILIVFPSAELVIRHLEEKDDILPIEHWHKYL